MMFDVSYPARLHTTATLASHNMIDRISQKNHIFCPEACARSKCEQPITGHSKLIEFNVTTLVFCRAITSKQCTSQRKNCNSLLCTSVSSKQPRSTKPTKPMTYRDVWTILASSPLHPNLVHVCSLSKPADLYTNDKHRNKPRAPPCCHW